MRTRVFFAIPCGEFYSMQERMIRAICKGANIEPIIIEKESASDGLWERITKAIDESDYFVADISSGSTNVIVELGYALREKLRPKSRLWTASAS